MMVCTNNVGVVPERYATALSHILAAVSHHFGGQLGRVAIVGSGDVRSVSAFGTEFEFPERVHLWNQRVLLRGPDEPRLFLLTAVELWDDVAIRLGMEPQQAKTSIFPELVEFALQEQAPDQYQVTFMRRSMFVTRPGEPQGATQYQKGICTTATLASLALLVASLKVQDVAVDLELVDAVRTADRVTVIL